MLVTNENTICYNDTSQQGNANQAYNQTCDEVALLRFTKKPVSVLASLFTNLTHWKHLCLQ